MLDHDTIGQIEHDARCNGCSTEINNIDLKSVMGIAQTGIWMRVVDPIQKFYSPKIKIYRKTGTQVATHVRTRVRAGSTSKCVKNVVSKCKAREDSAV